MPGINPSLLLNLKDVLRRCEIFTDDRHLKTVFVDARIASWRDVLPQRDTQADRVDAVIDCLFDQYNQKGENALVLFLRVLAEQQPPDNALQSELIVLAGILEPELAEATPPVIDLSSSTMDMRFASQKGLVEIEVRGTPATLSAKQTQRLLQKLAQTLGIPLETLRILPVQKESKVVQVVMPDDAVEKLERLYLSQPTLTESWGIQKVKRASDEERVVTGELESLDSEDIVLLIGAGVSNYLGLPSLDTLLQEAILRETSDNTVASMIRDAYNTIEAHANHTRGRFEELISQLRYYLNVAETVGRDSTFRRFVDGYLPSSIDNGDLYRKWWKTLTRCYRLLLEVFSPQKIDRESTEFITVLNLLEKLANLNSGRLHVYTTNYDTSFQVFASTYNRLMFFTQIDNSNGSFMDRWYKANPTLRYAGQPSIYVHRFHGCVGWFADSRRPFGIEEVYGSGDRLIIEDDNRLHSMQIKLTSAQAIGANPAFALAFEQFSQHLKTTKVLLVWGYSFRDIEVLRYINQAFTSQPRLIVLYIDPYLDEGQALHHIRSTVVDAPITLHPAFKPKRIDWRPVDGHHKLISTVTEATKNALVSLA